MKKILPFLLCYFIFSCQTQVQPVPENKKLSPLATATQPVPETKSPEPVKTSEPTAASTPAPDNSASGNVKISPFPINASLEEGSSLQIFANSNVPPYLDWKSANAQVASVDSGGLIYANFKGDTTINVSSAYDSTFAQKINVHVLPARTDISTPIHTECGSSDYCERVTFSGKVYDQDKRLIDGATVRAWSIDPNVVDWVGEAQVSSNGTFKFIAPVGVYLSITVGKNGYTSVKRGIILKSNLSGQTPNIINFGGIEMPNDSQFALKKN